MMVLSEPCRSISEGTGSRGHVEEPGKRKANLTREMGSPTLLTQHFQFPCRPQIQHVIVQLAPAFMMQRLEDLMHRKRDSILISTQHGAPTGSKECVQHNC